MRILHAIHDFLPRHQAGSEIYTLELCQALAKRRHHVSVLCADFDPSRTHEELSWRVQQDIPVVELVNNWRCRSFKDTYRSDGVTRQIEHVLHAIQPDVLHVHSLLNLSLNLPAVARARGIPVVATLHDYSLLCPSGGQRIHQAENHVCHDIDPRRCCRCFRESPFYDQVCFTSVTELPGASRAVARAVQAANVRFPQILRLARHVAQRAAIIPVTEHDVATRLEQVRDVFENVDLAVAPSQSIASEFRRFGLGNSKLRVSDYGFRRISRRNRNGGGKPLRIGYVGTLAWHKGVHILLDAVRRLRPTDYELRIFGDPEVFPGYSRILRRQAAGLPVVFRGPFDRAQIDDVYAAIDVLVVPSIWLENSPLVIHEAFMAGVPVVGARIGGIVDLIIDGMTGLLYDPKSPTELSESLRGLIEQPERVLRLAAQLPPIKSIEQDAEEWELRYAEVRTR